MSKDKFKWQRQKKVFSAIDGFYNSKKRKNRKIARPQSRTGRKGSGLLFYSFFALSVLMAGPRGRSGPCYFVKPSVRTEDLTSAQMRQSWIAREKVSQVGNPNLQAKNPNGTNVPIKTWDSYCQEIGCNRRTVNRWLNRAKAGREEKAWRLAQLGWTQREIGEIFGVDHALISKMVNNCKFAKIHQDLGPDWNEKVLKDKSLTRVNDFTTIMAEPFFAVEAKKRQETTQAKPGEKIGSKVVAKIRPPNNESENRSRYGKAVVQAGKALGVSGRYVSDARGFSSILARSSSDYMQVWWKSRKGWYNLPLVSRSSPQTATGRLKIEDKGLYRPAWKNFSEKY